MYDFYRSYANNSAGQDPDSVSVEICFIELRAGCHGCHIERSTQLIIKRNLSFRAKSGNLSGVIILSRGEGISAYHKAHERQPCGQYWRTGGCNREYRDVGGWQKPSRPHP